MYGFATRQTPPWSRQARQVCWCCKASATLGQLCTTFNTFRVWTKNVGSLDTCTFLLTVLRASKTFQAVVIRSFLLKDSKMYIYIYIYVHDTAAIVVGYCHTCWILLATDRESPSSLRVFQDFLHQPSYLRFSTRQMRTCKWVNRKTAKQDSSSKNWD